jgi:hypothetical protein
MMIYDEEIAVRLSKDGLHCPAPPRVRVRSISTKTKMIIAQPCSAALSGDQAATAHVGTLSPAIQSL